MLKEVTSPEIGERWGCSRARGDGVYVVCRQARPGGRRREKGSERAGQVVQPDPIGADCGVWAGLRAVGLVGDRAG